MVAGFPCILQVGALATGAWFLHHHFWALNVQLEGMQLRALCRLIFAAMVPATVLPGLVLARSSQGLINAFLLTQASPQNSLLDCSNICLCLALRLSQPRTAMLCERGTQEARKSTPFLPRAPNKTCVAYFQDMCLPLPLQSLLAESSLILLGVQAAWQIAQNKSLCVSPSSPQMSLAGQVCPHEPAYWQALLRPTC